MFGMLCWNTIKDTCQSWPTSFRAKRPVCRRYTMICFTSSLIRQLYHFATDFDRVLLQLVGTDIVNTLFSLHYRGSYRHLTFMIETIELLMKNCEIFDSWIFNVQLHAHLKNDFFLKFKVLYLLNRPSYFNKINKISYVNTRVQSLKVSLKSILPWPNYSIFSRGLFLVHPVYKIFPYSYPSVGPGADLGVGPYRQSVDWWLWAIHPVGCHYIPPVLQFQPKSVTAHRPVPNYTAWSQRHMRVSALPKAVTLKRTISDLDPRDLSDRERTLYTVKLEFHGTDTDNDTDFRDAPIV